MRKVLCLLLVCLSSVAWAQYERPYRFRRITEPTGYAGQPFFSIVPQGGINFSRLTADASGKGRAGYQIGVNAQMGRRAYFQPGILFVRRVPQLINPGEDQTLIKNDFGFTGLQVQTLVGYRIINSKAFRLRANAGPAATFLTSVDSNPFGLGMNEAKNTMWGLKAGGGIDIYFITLDLNYEVGLSKIVPDASKAQNNVLSINLGVRLDL